ncbi:MAG: TIGR01212 family radical SAM protein [Bacteroidetes bacterium]|nr:MAG: TIGR01212 family radical SAM protein [Bacteroidota bacterium]
MAYPWGTDRRFNAYSAYFKKHFGGRVQKVSVNAGFSCPNRDGSKGYGGCTYCDNTAFTPSYNDPVMPVGEQLLRGIDFHRRRYRKAKHFLAYFQSFSNTYAPLDRLRGLYEEALAVPGIVGIVIGTRPDCVDEALLDYLEILSRETYLVLEYGLESLHDSSLKRMNRGHDVRASRAAVYATSARGIRVGAHLIIGLPKEGEKELMQSIGELARWPLHSLKFHQLQIIRGTAMEEDYLQHPADFPELPLDRYLNLMVNVLEHLNPHFVVERIAGEVNPGKALLKGWGLRYDVVLKRFEALLAERDSFQGKHFKPASL